MRAAAMNSLGHSASAKRVGRRSRTLILAISVALTLSIGGLPAAGAFADQVLELPQATAPIPVRDTPTEVVGEAQPRHQAIAPMPSGLGSLDDYERQGEPARSTGLAS